MIPFGPVTASLSYDYKKSKFGTYDFSNAHVTIVRAGVTLVDQTLGKECSYCMSLRHAWLSQPMKPTSCLCCFMTIIVRPCVNLLIRQMNQNHNRVDSI